MKRSKNGFSGKQLELFGRNSSKIPKMFFRQRVYRMGLNWFYYLRILKKIEFWGSLQNYMGVFGKQFHSFQNRFNWQSFCSMILQHSNGKNAQNFSGVSNFFFFPWKTEGSFEKSLNFWKNWYIFQICSRRRSKNCFCLRILKTKEFTI